MSFLQDLISFTYMASMDRKYQKYINSYNDVSQDLRYLMIEENCDEIVRITINEGVYYEKNIVGEPKSNIFNYKINNLVVDIFL